MRTFDIQITRDGRWWMIRIPELDGVTQAEHPVEIEERARDYIAVALDLPIDSIAVRALP